VNPKAPKESAIMHTFPKTVSWIAAAYLASALAWTATAQPIAEEDFETSLLPADWTHYQGGEWPDMSCYDFHDPGEGSGLFLSLEACWGSYYYTQNTGIETETYDVSTCPSLTVEFTLYNADDEAQFCPGNWDYDDPPTGDCIGVSTDGATYDRLAHLTEYQYPSWTAHSVSLDADAYVGGSVSFYLAESDNYYYDYDGLLFDDFTVICGETDCDDEVDNDGDGDVDCDDDDCASGDVDGDGYTPCDGDCNDNDAAINPGAAEICDGFDNDCDWLVSCFFNVCSSIKGR